MAALFTLADNHDLMSLPAIYTAALLKDIGKTVLDGFVRDAFGKISGLVANENLSFMEAEKRVIGVDHAELGGMIAKIWKFSPKMVNIIRNHHIQDIKMIEDREIAVVYLADCICMMMGMGVGADGLAYRFHKDAMKEIGIAMESIPSNRGYMGDLYSQLARRYEKACDFKGAGSVTIISVTTMPGDDVTHPVPDNRKERHIMATKLSQDELLEAIDGMTVLELSEFIKAFEEHYGVTAAAPAAVAVAAAGGRDLGLRGGHGSRGAIVRHQQLITRDDQEDEYERENGTTIHRGQSPVCSGTGSRPPGCQGWQRSIRQTPFQVPMSRPYFRTAKMKYSLQVGSNRQ